MKLTIQRTYLNDAVQQVSKAISSRTTIPILSGIKMEANAAGVVFTASDTEISIQAFVPNELEGQPVVALDVPGSVVVPAKFFVEIVRKLPSTDVHIETSPQFQISIRSGSTDIQLSGADPEEFPLLPRLSEHQTLSIGSNVLDVMIRQVSFAVSSNESTPVLTGVLWSLREGKLKFVATDRHRLASVEKPVHCPEEIEFHNIVISGKNLTELGKILPEQNTTVDIVVAENQVLFRTGNILFFSRILDGTYPDTSKIIPSSYRTETVFRTRPLADAMDRAYLLSREEKTNIVRMTTSEDEKDVEISSSSSEIGRVTEQLSIVRFAGEPLKISFNSKYLLDVLKVTDSGALWIGFTGPMSPMILRPDDDDQVLHLILPYRTTN